MQRRKLSEVYKNQILSFKQKNKKEKSERQIPNFKNLEIDYHRANDKDINILVKDVFSDEEKKYKTTTHTIKKSGSSFLINTIHCPLCGKSITLNKHWQTYICQDKSHDKINLEICYVFDIMSGKLY